MAMDSHTPSVLRGRCSCGRNRYTISIPSSIESEPESESAQLIFSTSSNDRHTQASPLVAWLRVPLHWYQSSTHAYNSDETHFSIRRTYSPPYLESEKRQFCAHCGTHLNVWTEDPVEEADFIAVTVGSLLGDDLDNLDELGLRLIGSEDGISSKEGVMVDGSWFGEMTQGSQLGKVTRRMGRRREGNVSVEWEVIEWEDDGEEGESGTVGKRKRGVEEEDVDMGAKI